ncbi:hypothetical protein HMPREF0083_01215 [Aneurinibacillus aneurinilyticus ATCC 12856]|uniref:Uncharacterized protein n=1 Tax=Aneurinibacillus aneurinilyticus ATCC 12856 TaxID=649747 RepID=U1YIS1_ANEAE|nr:hypothetical protein HMPREF0083_01215 [Aneurinibacillus aneurinilyticus ATCC 12856]
MLQNRAAVYRFHSGHTYREKCLEASPFLPELVVFVDEVPLTGCQTEQSLLLLFRFIIL